MEHFSARIHELLNLDPNVILSDQEIAHAIQLAPFEERAGLQAAYIELQAARRGLWDEHHRNAGAVGGGQT